MPPSDSLRMRVVEAGARAIAKGGYRGRNATYPGWDNYKGATQQHYRNQAQAALDAMLGCLTENRSDWADWNAAECADADEGCNCVSDAQVLGLIAALRESP